MDKQIDLQLKTVNGLIYYRENDKWKLAGRENHPLTQRYIKLLKGEPSCLCGCARCGEN
jgi:hypothetical protein